MASKLTRYYAQRRRTASQFKPTKETESELLNFAFEFLAELNANEKGIY